MRLSTAVDRDEARGLDVLHAALDAGVALFDTANAYCLDATETGHNERLIARALGTWSGDRSTVRVATKGGLTRPGGRWEADGRARALTAACEASLTALGVSRIGLYQLHAPDPRVPLATSVRALHALRRCGLIEAIGLCNVTVGQIEEARRLTSVDAVQVELSLWHDDNVLSGVVDYCTANGIPLLAYRPLGGPGHRRRIETDPVLERVAADLLQSSVARSPGGSEQTPATDRAVVLWCDGVLQRSRAGHRTPMSPDDVEVLDGRGARLRRHAEEGWRVFGVTWLPEIAEGTMSHADAAAVFTRLRELLAIDLEIEYCPHAAGPPSAGAASHCRVSG